MGGTSDGGWLPPPPATATAFKPTSSRAPLRFLPKSLASRLVFGVVSLVLVLVVLVGAATYTALSPFLSKRLDDQLVSVSNPQNINRYLSYAARPSLAPPGAQDVWFTGLSPNGSVLVTVPSDLLIHPLNLSAADRSEMVSHVGELKTVTTTDGIELRLTSVRVNFGQAGSDLNIEGVAIVGLSTHDVRDTLHRLVSLELFIGAAAVLFAAGLTAWGVRVGLRPLHRVTRTAQEVTAELGPDGAGLDRRVPHADPATEVGQVATSVNTLLQAVETEFAARVRSEDRMRQFLADASHELRTPLTSIRGYAELSRLQVQDTDVAKDTMRRIEVEGTRMSRLVEDLLVLARGDQDAPTEYEPVEVDGLLSDAASAAGEAHPERPLSVRSSGGAVVMGDRDQLRRALVNLLNNSALHTAPGGSIRIEASVGRMAAGPTVAIRVIDEGPGLPPEEAAHVFERFWRADKARSRAKGGSGLGMAIVAQIVQAHHGTVTFDSTVHAGTTVTVLLPMAFEQPRLPTAE
jgi:two-component system OmpR family sensor kinase